MTTLPTWHPASHPVSSETIIAAVADYYHVTVEEIRGQSRSLSVVRPRLIAVYLVREMLQMTQREIAPLFNRERSAACREVQWALRTVARDQVLFRQVGELMRIVEAAWAGTYQQTQGETA